jgi:hypothetical protein
MCAWPTLALPHAAYVQRQDLEAAIGFDEAGRWMPLRSPGWSKQPTATAR